jgi:hypothetical protein
MGIFMILLTTTSIMGFIRQPSVIFSILFLLCIQLNAQDYFLKDKMPFDLSIPSPEAFLGYPIGEQHTLHDQIV